LQTGNIWIYSQTGYGQNPIGAIVGFAYPTGLWVNTKGDLYVVDSFRSAIDGYRHGAIAPFTTLQDPNPPWDACGDDRGTIYVVDAGSSQGGPADTVEVYVHGAIYPRTKLVDPRAAHMNSCMVDGAGDLFVSYATGSSGGAGVDEFPKGSTTPILLVGGLDFAPGIALTRNGNLVVNAATSSSGQIVTYAPPYTGSPVGSFAYSGNAGGIALNRDERNVWLANSTSEEAQEYTYPGGQLIDSTSKFDSYFPYAVTLYPADRP
jgi:hypothetical protein